MNVIVLVDMGGLVAEDPTMPNPNDSDPENQRPAPEAEPLTPAVMEFIDHLVERAIDSYFEEQAVKNDPRPK